jgi:hypothetical protein
MTVAEEKIQSLCTEFKASTLAPLNSKIFTISTFPSVAAICRGVLPNYQTIISLNYFNYEETNLPDLVHLLSLPQKLISLRFVQNHSQQQYEVLTRRPRTTQ